MKIEIGTFFIVELKKESEMIAIFVEAVLTFQ
jgi:hypothetical protein